MSPVWEGLRPQLGCSEASWPTFPVLPGPGPVLLCVISRVLAAVASSDTHRKREDSLAGGTREAAMEFPIVGSYPFMWIHSNFHEQRLIRGHSAYFFPDFPISDNTMSTFVYSARPTFE